MTSQDEHGDPVVTWTSWAEIVPAEIVPVSGREFLAGQGIVGQVTTKIRIRWRPGVVETMRALHTVDAGSPGRVDIYNIAAVLPDPDSGRVFVWLMCARGVNDG